MPSFNPSRESAIAPYSHSAIRMHSGLCIPESAATLLFGTTSEKPLSTTAASELITCCSHPDLLDACKVARSIKPREHSKSPLTTRPSMPGSSMTSRLLPKLIRGRSTPPSHDKAEECVARSHNHVLHADQLVADCPVTDRGSQICVPQRLSRCRIKRDKVTRGISRE